jgi:hypothetical protein
MTAEIAVLSRVGIAMAADSAVTVGHEARKIFTSSEKLFQLSSVAPVGIMTYGNAEFAALPWEVIIKAYRAHLGAKRFRTLKGYANDFFRFLGNNHWLFERSQYKVASQQFLEDMLQVFRRHAATVFTKQARKLNGLSLQNVQDLLANEVASMARQMVKNHALLPGKGRSLAGVRTHYRTMVNDLVSDIFDKLPMTTATRNKLRKSAFEALRREVFTDSRSGVVIAGYGESEFSPFLCHYTVEGAIYESPRLVVDEQSGLDRRNRAAVLAFAQRDAATTFMEGVAPNLDAFFRQTSADMIRVIANETVRVASQTSPSAAKGVKKLLDVIIPRALEQLFKIWDSRKHQLHTAPVVGMVGSLPKDELAAVADALVNITKLKRRITPESETVGGPIDVAIITRGDGFVWLRRKHYFDPALNPRVIARLGGKSHG